MARFRAEEFHGPGRVRAVNPRVLGHGFQPILERVFLKDFLQNVSWFPLIALRGLRLEMPGSVVQKNCLGVVKPVIEQSLISRLRLFEVVLFVFGILSLDLELRATLLLSFSELVQPSGDHRRSVGDSGDLSPEVVLLLSEEERIRDDLSFEVACEQDLDLASGCDVLRRQVGKNRPLA